MMTTSTRSAAAAEKQRVSCACLPRPANWSCNARMVHCIALWRATSPFPISPFPTLILTLTLSLSLTLPLTLSLTLTRRNGKRRNGKRRSGKTRRRGCTIFDIQTLWFTNCWPKTDFITKEPLKLIHFLQSVTGRQRVAYRYIILLAVSVKFSKT